MKVKELSKEQLAELKVRYYDEYLEQVEGRNISYGEIADIHSLVSNRKIFKEYENTDFVEEDFFTS